MQTTRKKYGNHGWCPRWTDDAVLAYFYSLTEPWLIKKRVNCFGFSFEIGSRIKGSDICSGCWLSFQRNHSDTNIGGLSVKSMEHRSNCIMWNLYLKPLCQIASRTWCEVKGPSQAFFDCKSWAEAEQLLYCEQKLLRLQAHSGEG